MKTETVALSKVHPSPDNVRTHEDPEDLERLAASIRTVGILEPLVVTPNAKGYELVAGSRRLAAARLAGLRTVDVVIREDLVDDHDPVRSHRLRQEAMLIENLQRADLLPLEEGGAYARLLALTNSTQKELASRLGVSQSHISKRLALVDLPDIAKAAVDSGGISVTDAGALTQLKDAPDRVVEIAIDLIGEEDWKPDEAVRAALDVKERDDAIVAATEQAKADPATYVEPVGDRDRYDKNNVELRIPNGMVRLSKDYGGLPITPAKHRKEPCHAITVIAPPRWTGTKPTIAYICTTPANHPDVKPVGHHTSTGQKTGPLSDAEKTKRRRRREHAAELREAHTDRRAFLTKLFAKKLSAALKDDVLQLLVVEWKGREIGAPWHKRGAWAAQLLGLDVKARGFMQADYRGAVGEYAAAHPGDILRISLAVALGVCEDSLEADYITWAELRPYFEFLERQGYETHTAERLELTGKAPKK